jgi:hypothetical protein
MADWKKITDENLDPDQARITVKRDGKPVQYKEIDWSGRLREIKRELDTIEKFMLNPFTVKPEKRGRLWDEAAKKKHALKQERFAILEAIRKLRASQQKGKRKRKLK